MEYISYTPFKNVLQHQIKKINFVVLISFYTISLVHTGTYGIPYVAGTLQSKN